MTLRKETIRKESNSQENYKSLAIVEIGNSKQTSPIIHINVSSDSSKEVHVFTLEEVADVLDTDTEQVKLKLSIMLSKRTIIPC